MQKIDNENDNTGFAVLKPDKVKRWAQFKPGMNPGPLLCKTLADEHQGEKPSATLPEVTDLFVLLW